MSVVPLGAGDLIDRAVRFYRKYFLTFVLIAAPPVLVATVVSFAWTYAGRKVFLPGSDPYGADIFYYIFLRIGAFAIWLVEMIVTLVVMGGASRNFVRHLLFDEAISFGETYRNAGKRIMGLIIASTLITILLGAIGTMIIYFGLIVGFLAIGLIGYALSFIPIVAIILSLVIGIAVATGCGWLFFLVASRVAYVPQVMLVEGLGVMSSIARSASLANGNVRRLAALFIFTTVAAYSALAILYVPLVWYAEANGVDIFTFYSELTPAWYEIASNLIWQISFVLLSPVWTIGLCLLYVDERVRGEGYDIELMAAARLGEIPSVPEIYVNPLHPAISATPTAAPQIRPNIASREDKSITTLGLN